MKKNGAIIKVGLSSFGKSGRLFHAPFIHLHPGFELCKVWERTKDLSRRHYPYVEVVRRYEELLDDPEIDLIVVNTPNHTHYDLTKRALQAGKHVVVEKPITHEPAEAVELIETAERNGNVLSVYQNRRWDGDFMTVRHIIENRLVGNIVEYESHFDRFRNFLDMKKWKEQKEVGAGVLFDLGSHMIDQALVLFGLPAAVSADIRAFREGANHDDYYNLRLHYPDVAVILKGGFHVREPLPRYIVNGDMGGFVKYGVDPQEQALDEDRLPNTPNWGHDPEENWGILNTDIEGLHFRGRIETLPGNYMEYYKNLYDALTGNAALEVPGRAGLDVIRVIHAAYESSRRQEVVKL
ncbi:MAG: Gfo/Idh/MocA family oxidoreductase [Verrucomicrobia bacterium]|nr:Gfo/Idh/MocA family oxidoreductase [Verrucomicrobiota bacterium]